MFCLEYYSNQRYYKNVEEVKIKYKKTFKALQAFLQKFENQTVIIDLSEGFDEIDLRLFRALYSKYKNFKLTIDFFNEQQMKLIQQYKNPFFFSNPVTTIDQLYGFLKYQPSDMYICEILGFSLDRISELLHEKNVKVRVYPNICQSSFPGTPSLKTFFIRPEDIEFYSNFVDVFELISDRERQYVIYKIYKQGKWLGPINQIIPSFKDDLDSRYLLNTFALFRVKCGKKCMYGNKCKLCDNFVSFSKVLEKENIVVKKEEEKENKEE